MIRGRSDHRVELFGVSVERRRRFDGNDPEKKKEMNWKDKKEERCGKIVTRREKRKRR